MTATSKQYVVVCEHYESKPTAKRESAQRDLDEIERLAACTAEHRIEER